MPSSRTVVDTTRGATAPSVTASATTSASEKPLVFAITGAAGFIGSHLTDRLLAAGHSVIGFDNFVTGRPENLAHLADHDRFRLIEADVSLALPLPCAIDGIFHLASAASPPDYQQWPVETLRVGALGTLLACEAAQAHQARILFASTSEVYGDPLEHPQPETYWGHVNSIGPRSMYDEAKRFGEATLMAFHRSRGVDTRIARIFNTYGPRMRPDDGRVVSNFLVQALTGQPLTCYGDGSQTRSFGYVDDTVEGLIRLFFRGNADPVNLGNPHEFTVLELAHQVRDLVARATGSTPVAIEHRPLPGDDPKVRRPVIDRAQALLGWTPRVQLAEGLEVTMRYFANRLGVPIEAA